MKRLIASMGLLVVMSTLWTFDVIAPKPSLASWVSANCAPNHANVSYWRRKDAQAYAAVARHEGYEWGGGCWNDNNHDDTPGQPDSSGEGPDCSGLVFKTWALRNVSGDYGFTWYDKLENVHGKFTTWNYKYPASSDPFVRLPDKSRDRMQYMDAFSSDTHIGMLWTGTSPGSNTDYVMEALGDAYGTDVFVESYRADSRYAGVRRKNWTPDCYPSCRGPEAVEVVP